MERVAKILGTLSVVGCAVVNIPLEAADLSGWYGGINIGQSMAKIDHDRIRSGLGSAGFTTTSISDDDRDIGYKLFGGYQLNKYFALEGGYFDLGEFEFKATTVPAGTLRGNIKVKGLNFDAVGIWPFTEKFSAFGRVGVTYAESKDRFRGTGLVTTRDSSPSERDASYKFGLGLQFHFTESLGMRAEAERYRIDDAVGNKGDIDLISVGLVYRLGKSR